MWRYIMKSNIKVEYVEAGTLEELKELVDKTISAIQVNIKNTIKDIKTITRTNGGFLVQITYEEERQILNESEEVK